MDQEKVFDQMTDEELLDAFEIESFEHGFETEYQKQLRIEILGRMRKE